MHTHTHIHTTDRSGGLQSPEQGLSKRIVFPRPAWVGSMGQIHYVTLCEADWKVGSQALVSSVAGLELHITHSLPNPSI